MGSRLTEKALKMWKRATTISTIANLKQSQLSAASPTLHPVNVLLPHLWAGQRRGPRPNGMDANASLLLGPLGLSSSQRSGLNTCSTSTHRAFFPVGAPS